MYFRAHAPKAPYGAGGNSGGMVGNVKSGNAGINGGGAFCHHQGTPAFFDPFPAIVPVHGVIAT